MERLREALAQYDAFHEHDETSRLKLREGPLAEAARAVLDGQPVWWCEVLHLAYPRGDDSPGARVGLPDYCVEEQHEGCEWVVTVPERVLVDPKELR